MRYRILFAGLVVLMLLAGCGGASKNDLAVCDAYQALVDSWPADSDAVTAAGSGAEIRAAVEEAGEALVTASQSAKNPELAEVGEIVGGNAAKFFELNADMVESGFIPFFAEYLIGGEELSQLCADIGRPISLP